MIQIFLPDTCDLAANSLTETTFTFAASRTSIASLLPFFNFLFLGKSKSSNGRKQEGPKIWGGGSSNVVGIICPPPWWNMVNRSAQNWGSHAPPPPSGTLAATEGSRTGSKAKGGNSKPTSSLGGGLNETNFFWRPPLHRLNNSNSHRKTFSSMHHLSFSQRRVAPPVVHNAVKNSN